MKRAAFFKFALWLEVLVFSLFIGILAFPTTATSSDLSNEGKKNFISGVIEGGWGEENVLLDKKCFVIGFDVNGRTLEFTATHITRNEVISSKALCDRGSFRTDKALPKSARIYTTDYNGIGDDFNRGHMARFDDLNGQSLKCACDSMLMSNIVPQLAELNQGIWLYLENEAQRMAAYFSEVWSYAGAIYEIEEGEPLYTVGKKEDRQIPYPHGFFKIIARKKSGKIKAIAFYFSNFDYGSGSKKKLKKRIVTIKYIENKTGLSFFPKLKSGNYYKWKKLVTKKGKLNHWNVGDTPIPELSVEGCEKPSKCKDFY